SPATATLCRPQLSAPPLTLKPQIAYRATAVPVPPTATTTSAALIPQPQSLSETGKSDQTLASNPHRLTPPPAQTPPRFPPLRLFGRLPPCTPSPPMHAAGRNPKHHGSFQGGPGVQPPPFLPRPSRRVRKPQ